MILFPIYVLTRNCLNIVVDKTLLETPEDDIEYEKVPLRDLIILAEHREREMVCKLSIALWFIIA